MKKVLFFLFLLIIISVGVFFFLLTPISSDTNEKDFVINQGDSLLIIATRLEKNELIRNRYTFVLCSYFLNLSSRLQAGTFKLSQNLSTIDVITKLSKGGSNDHWLKIIDGSRVEELPMSFPRSQEGYLFPDSYLIPQDYTVEETLSVIRENFDKNFQKASENPSDTGLSDKQSIILASLLEREARTLESKRAVAGILLNRIEINMPLQVDATIQYARDSAYPRPKKYWLPITKNHLSLDSPFNTYKNIGLPPSPICNPGYDSIFAAFHPTSSDYLFYITGTDGQMHYARTLDEHNSNIAKYLK